MKGCIATVQDAVINMKDDVIIDAVKKCLAEGLSPIQIIEEGLSGGLDVVGQKFEAGEYYLAELIMAGDVVTEATGMLKDKMDPGDMGKKGKVILATVKGDVHDIGKNIVSMILSAQGYEIVDLGVDVASEKIGNTASGALRAFDHHNAGHKGGGRPACRQGTQGKGENRHRRGLLFSTAGR